MRKSFLIILLLFLFALPSSALTSTSYADLASTSSQAINLLNYAYNIESFSDSDFVIYRDNQYSYYIVWGDLVFSGQSVTGSDVEYCRYYRTGDAYSSSYLYDYGSASDFSLDIVYAIVSNIPNCGFAMPTYFEYLFYDNFDYFVIFSISFLFVLMLKVLRR